MSWVSLAGFILACIVFLVGTLILPTARGRYANARTDRIRARRVLIPNANNTNVGTLTIVNTNMDESLQSLELVNWSRIPAEPGDGWRIKSTIWGGRAEFDVVDPGDKRNFHPVVVAKDGTEVDIWVGQYATPVYRYVLLSSGHMYQRTGNSKPHRVQWWNKNRNVRAPLPVVR